MQAMFETCFCLPVNCYSVNCPFVILSELSLWAYTDFCIVTKTCRTKSVNRSECAIL